MKPLTPFRLKGTFKVGDPVKGKMTLRIMVGFKEDGSDAVEVGTGHYEGRVVVFHQPVTVTDEFVFLDPPQNT